MKRPEKDLETVGCSEEMAIAVNWASTEKVEPFVLHGLSKNQHIKWDDAIIDEYLENWNWYSLCENNSIDWNSERVLKYLSKIYWGTLSKNPTFKLSDKLFRVILDSRKKLKDVLWGLSSNSQLPWSEEFIAKYEDEFDWLWLSRNPSLPWSNKLIDRFEDKWNWTQLPINNGIIWTDKLINRYKNRLEWKQLSASAQVDWSEELIAKFEDKWNWSWGGLSSNPNLPWHEPLIERYTDKWNWECLSSNSGISLNENLLTRWVELWEWEKIRRRIVHSPSLLEKFRLNIRWKWLCPDHLTLELLNQFSEHWDYSHLSSQESIHWTEEMIVRYANKWDWYELIRNQSVPWNADLFEIAFAQLLSDEKLKQRVTRFWSSEEALIKVAELGAPHYKVLKELWIDLVLGNENIWERIFRDNLTDEDIANYFQLYDFMNSAS